MPEIDVNTMVWRFSLSATVKAAVHLGHINQDHPRTTKNTDFNKDKILFDISKELILDHCQEIDGQSTIDWNTVPWMRTTLLNDRAVKLSTAKVFVLAKLVSIHDQ